MDPFQARTDVECGGDGTCPTIQQLLQWVHDPEHPESGELEAHIESCKRCGELLEQLLVRLEQTCYDRHGVAAMYAAVELSQRRDRFTRRAWLFTAAATALGGAGVALALWPDARRRAERQPRLAQGEPDEPRSSGGSDQPGGAIVFDVSHPDATISIDGQTVAQGNFRQTVRYEPGIHHVKLETPQRQVQRLIGLTEENSEFVSLPESGDQLKHSGGLLHEIRYDPKRSLDLGADFGEVRSLALSRNDQLLAIAGGQGGSHGALRLRQLESGEDILPERLEKQPDGVPSVAISPDRTLLAWSIFNRHQLLVHRLGEAEPVLREKLDEVARVSFSSQGRLAIATQAGSLRVWEPQRAAPPARLLDQGVGYHCVAWSPDGQRIIAGGGQWRPWGFPRDFGQIDVVDAGAGRLHYRLEGHAGTVLAAAVSPDGTVLATAGVDRHIHFWELASGRPLHSIREAHDSVIECLAFSPEGTMIASGGWDNRVKLWSSDVRTGQTQNLATLNRHTFFVQSVVFSHDAQWLISSGADGTVRFWHLSLAQMT